MTEFTDRIVEQAAQADSGWGSAYGLFSGVIRDKKLLRGAEIGVAYGGHAEAILRQTDVRRLYGVDPYVHQDGYDDPMNVSQEEFDALYRFTLKRLSSYGDRFELVREFSCDGVKRIVAELDFVYIDAVHTYSGVWSDLCSWFGKVREGGVIGGHDYDHPNFPGVRQAVDTFFGRLGWSVRTEGEGVWWVEKCAVNVSFIIPAYNCAETISETVASIVNENCSPGDEIIIVNDGSTDQTEALLKRLEATYDLVKTISHTRNKGGAAARNSAVENAKNEILFCLDSDNLLAEGSIPQLKRFLLAIGADVAAFQELRYFSGRKEDVSHKWVFKEGKTSLADYLSGRIVPGSSGNYMYTRASWEKGGGYPEFAGALDAWGFGLRQVATGQQMLVMPKSHYYHRYGHESYWVRDAKRGKFSLTALQILIPFLDQIEPEDVDYVMSSEHRNHWFERLDQRPMRVRGTPTGEVGKGVRSPTTRFRSFMSRLRLALHTLFD